MIINKAIISLSIIFSTSVLILLGMACTLAALVYDLIKKRNINGIIILILLSLL